MVETVGNAASLTTGMHRDDPELVGQGMHDTVVTPARAKLIDGYEQVREAALAAVQPVSQSPGPARRLSPPAQRKTVGNREHDARRLRRARGRRPGVPDTYRRRR